MSYLVLFADVAEGASRVADTAQKVGAQVAGTVTVINWGAIFAGVVFTFALHGLLSLLIVALGLSVDKKGREGEVAASAFGAMTIAGYVALFFGAVVTSYVSVQNVGTGQQDFNPKNPIAPMILQGGLMWATLFALALLLLALGIQTALSGVLGVAQTAVSAAGSAAGGAAQGLGSALGGLANSGLGQRAADEAAKYLDPEALKKAGFNEDQLRQLQPQFDKLKANADEARRQAEEALRRARDAQDDPAVKAAGFAVFGAVLVSLLVSLIGSYAGMKGWFFPNATWFN